MTSTLWSPPSSSLGCSSYFLSPLSPYDQRNNNNNSSGSQHLPGGLPAPLLASSPVNNNNRRRRTQSLMDNSLDLLVDGDSSNMLDGDVGDSGYVHQQNTNNYQRNPPQMACHRNNNMQFLSPVTANYNSIATSSSSSANSGEIIASTNPPMMGNFTSLAQFLHCRTELLVTGQQATPWNHFTIVGQLRKLENLKLIDRSLIKQENPPLEILTLVQKLVKYNLAMEIIDSEDEQLRQEHLAKLIKLRCEEVLAISGSITEITERRQAIYTERCRIRLAMKELAAEIAAKTRKDSNVTPVNEITAATEKCIPVTTRLSPSLLQTNNTNTNTNSNKPLICL